MTTATQSRPSWTHDQSRPSWTSDERVTLQPDPPSGARERLRTAMPSPPPRTETPQRRKGDGDGVKHASSMSPRQTTELVESLQVFVERMQTIENTGDGTSLMDSVRKFARNMQQKVAKLGGTAARAPTAERPDGRRSRSSIVNGDDLDRPSFSCSLDGYRPDIDVVAPISVRPNAMELLWVCGDCGEHYPRARQCPETCTSCGAPKQNFYAPIED